MKLSNKFDVIIEISKNSQLKHEVDKKTGKLRLDRILFGSYVYPHNYGYIENTLADDGDPLDVIVVSGHELLPNTVVKCRILGSLDMLDAGERDTKLIGIIDVDNRYKNIVHLSDIKEELIEEIKDFFSNYKNLENKKIEILKLLNWSETEKIIQEGILTFKKK